WPSRKIRSPTIRMFTPSISPSRRRISPATSLGSCLRTETVYVTRWPLLFQMMTEVRPSPAPMTRSWPPTLRTSATEGSATAMRETPETLSTRWLPTPSEMVSSARAPPAARSASSATAGRARMRPRGRSIARSDQGRRRGQLLRPTTAELPHHELNLLAADVVLVAVFDLAALDALLVEPGPVRRAEVLDVVLGPVAQDDGVLAGDLPGVDHEVAVLAAADHEAVLRDLVHLAALGHEVEAGALFRRGRLLARVAAAHVVHLGDRAVRGLLVVAAVLVLALDQPLQLRGGLQHALGHLAADRIVLQLGGGARIVALAARHRRQHGRRLLRSARRRRRAVGGPVGARRCSVATAGPRGLEAVEAREHEHGLVD